MSQSTKSNEKLRKQRTFLVDGQEVLMQEHLSLGKAMDPTQTCQVHFMVKEGVLYLGRLGSHLDTSST